ncbi:MAG: hypothetical protein P8182_05415, partial [Deltaproteobacteria bacterium]
MIDHHSIISLLLETGTITKRDYSAALHESKETGKSPHEILLLGGKFTVDELVQALTIHLDITLLKEALGMERGGGELKLPSRP